MEIGGYLELEKFSGGEYYADAIALNLARNCIRILIRKKGLKRIYLPIYLCSSVIEAVKKTGIEITYYDIKEDFTPCLACPIDEYSWIYIVNYYGQLNNTKLEELRARYGRIVVDNAHSFFQKPIDGVDTIYSCRKFFGVSDGAYLVSDINDDDLEIDKSYDRMSAVLGRYEKSAQEFYQQFRLIEDGMSEWEIMKMSKITRNLLAAVDYDFVRQKREYNYRVVEKQLADINELKFRMPPGPFVYPLYIERAQEVCRKLVDRHIYVTLFWREVLRIADKRSTGYRYAEHIIPLPIDHRYSEREMDWLCSEVKKCINCGN